MGPLDKIRPIDVTPSASQKVAERLTSLIASGNIAPGDKLPSENQLSRPCTSRGPWCARRCAA